MQSRFDLRDWTVRRGMLLAGLVLSAAIALAVCLPISVVVAVVLLCFILLLLPPIRRIVPFFCIAVMLIGLWRGAMYRLCTIEPQCDLAGRVDAIEGIVEECPLSGNMYRVRITDAKLLPTNSRVLLYCSEIVAPTLGDIVTSTVEFKALYDTQRYHSADSIFLQAYPTTFDEGGVVSRPGHHRSWSTALRPFRTKLTDSIESLLNGDEGSLLAAVCLGDRSSVSAEVSKTFRSSGLSHLLSVSGLHMSVIAGGMLLLMRTLRVKRACGNGLTAMVILLFMWLVEFTPSVTRAGVMYLVLIIGQMTRYQSDSLNSLGLALALILLASPSSVYDVGLWLSFAATVGILCITPRISSVLNKPLEDHSVWWLKPIKSASESIAISVGCTLPTVPLLLLVFGEISLVSPLSNLLCVLPACWMTILGCLGSLISIVPLLGFLGRGMLTIAGLLAKWLITVSEWCSAIRGAVLRPTSLWVIVLIAGAGVILSFAMVRLPFRQVCAVLSALLFAFIAAQPISAHMSVDSVAVSLTVDDNSTVVVVQNGTKAVVIARGADDLFAARRLMERVRAYEPQMLVISQCKPQHEAYLADWKREYPLLTAVSYMDTASVLSDLLLTDGDSVSFWDGCSLRYLTDEWCLFTYHDTSLLFALSSRAVYTESLPVADAVLLYGSAITDNHAVSSDVVFCVSDFDEMSAENICILNDKQSVSLLTQGDDHWRWLRRSGYVLE